VCHFPQLEEHCKNFLKDIYCIYYKANLISNAGLPFPFGLRLANRLSSELILKSAQSIVKFVKTSVAHATRVEIFREYGVVEFVFKK